MALQLAAIALLLEDEGEGRFKFKGVWKLPFSLSILATFICGGLSTKNQNVGEK